MRDLSKQSASPDSVATKEWVAESGGSLSYEHVQTVSSSDWVITHGLEAYPSTVIIIDEEEVEADVHYNSINQVTIHFSSPQVGKVELYV